ncbi:DUF3313 domain-containing protein [Pelagibius sp. Alg239-R121]|uniref:DUF3313 domain-containing protein n=1 Tax=Pelagibius sp. Alg239-R121 TaxID=2993448 RepID=UPI0024A6F904|nr:DUF3313 domain-containing protein [Pelagibius sp. Alg239-R121]
MQAVRVFFLLVFVLFGCENASRQARNVEYSGFLGDYSQLRASTDEGFNQVYMNPKLDNPEFVRRYTKVLLDPVVIYRDPKEKDLMLSSDLQGIADNFFMLLQNELSKDYEVVRSPDRETLRIAVAITNASKDIAVLDTLSTLVPSAFAVSTLYSYAADAPGFSGDVSIEARFSDGISGEIYKAAVDRRIGQKSFSAESLDSWQTVNDAILFWSRYTRFNLCELRGDSDCEKPS